MGLFIVRELIFRQPRCGHAKVFTGPGSQIDIFATLAAKWTKYVGVCVNTVTATRRTDDQFGLSRGGRISGFHEQSVNSKAASSLHA